MKQLELFPDFNPKPNVSQSQLVMSVDSLLQWKQRIFDYQQSANIQPQQGTLFDIAPAEQINPFKLQLQNLAYLDLPDSGDRTCLYFIIDNTLPLLLYVGETKLTAKQRWVNHYCDRYILHYIELHRRYSLNVGVGIAFCYDAPVKRSQRLKLESELIYQWRSPFNKECWSWWGQPFGK